MIDVATPTSDMLPAAQVDDRIAAYFFRVLSSPIRLGVLRLLLHGERCVSDLVEELGIAQPRLSNHLACLRTCGFVSVRRQGTYLYYALANEQLAELLLLTETLAASSTGTFAECSVLRDEGLVLKD
jgi:ArsR family transcriptional regulator, cadmium/lead-responsive transcriptional repressor